MNDSETLGDETWGDPDTAFEFHGEWKEFLPIALTNLLLTIVTLGIYRFWAMARTRRYLWSRTRFIDDTLEWTGTGKEMFLGFLIVFLIILPVLVGLQLLIEALILRQEFSAVVLLFLIFYLALFYLIGVAQFRALRYRLSRSWWHGIRGGSEDGGWAYGLGYTWKTILGWMAAALMVPWSMTSLWNDRWNRMSFGQHSFQASAEIGNLIVRWLLIFLVPFGALIILAIAAGGYILANGGRMPEGDVTGPIAFALGILAFYIAFLIATVSYYAAFFRQVVSATSWAGVDFQFTARTKDWMRLILGNIGLVLITLGAGLLFIPYRNWAFAIRHLEATGEINLDRLLQSVAAAPTEAEGLADAFDIGAI